MSSKQSAAVRVRQRFDLYPSQDVRPPGEGGRHAGAARQLPPAPRRRVPRARMRAREQGLPVPAAALLMSPCVDMETTGKSYETNQDSDARDPRAGRLGTATARAVSEGVAGRNLMTEHSDERILEPTEPRARELLG